MNLELFFNIFNILFAFGSNNWVSAGISILIFLYNIYLKLRKRKLMSFIFEEQKENRSSGSRVSIIYKVNSFLLFLVSFPFLICHLPGNLCNRYFYLFLPLCQNLCFVCF